MEINLIGVAGAAFLGGLVTALLGFFKSHEPWDWRKFGVSVITSVIGAGVVVWAANYEEILSPMIYFYAFLSGAGVEVGLHRALPEKITKGK